MRLAALVALVLYVLPLFAEQCDLTPGMADSYLLALSWQPGFCKTNPHAGDKRECAQLKSSDFYAKHLSLHGLWPNQHQCGTHYGFCQSYEKAEFCHYNPVLLTEQTKTSLKQYMPSYFYGSCLERHEWEKHGRCQLLDSDAYFELALKLTKEIDESALGAFILKNAGHKVSRHDMVDAIKASFGERNVKQIKLGCHQGVLVDVYVNLPKDLDNHQTLTDLLNRAPDNPTSDTCSHEIYLIGINK